MQYGRRLLLLGALLFGAYVWLNLVSTSKIRAGSNAVHITTNKIPWLKATWPRQFGRALTFLLDGTRNIIASVTLSA